LKFLADECCDAGLVVSLRAAGHDVTYVTEQNAGSSDDEVLLRAYDEGRILLTEDKDFGELAYRLRKPSLGIVLIRIDVKDRDLKWPRFKKLIEKYEERLPGHFVVIQSNRYRFRPLIFSL
jgi:predicted nuclease of predicted toxin-antitoxin system